MKIVLVCASGMSSNLLLSRMKNAAFTQGIDTKIWSIGYQALEEHINEADVIVLGPQLKYALESIIEIVNDKPILLIDARTYGQMNGPYVLEQVLNITKK